MTDDTDPSRRRAAFLDRDGVINVDRGYAYRPEQLELTPTAAEGIRLLNEAGLLVVVVTNQSGVARGLYTCAQVDALHDHLRQVLATQGARIDAFYYAPYHPDGSVEPFRCEHHDRKPGSGMLLRAIEDWAIDPAGSFLIGDQPRDLAAAHGAGVVGIAIEADIGDLAQVVRHALFRSAAATGKVTD